MYCFVLYKIYDRFTEMLPGFNHNLNVEGVLFHVQTEDKGVDTAIVETHVFVGGAIVCVKKTSYDEWMLYPDRRERVGQLMKVQHKTLLKQLANKEVPEAKAFLKKSS